MQARILNASAGSGKTYRLAYQWVRDVVEQPALYSRMLAVTFTNKATEEMKTRILREIHLLASGGASAYRQQLMEELRLDADAVQARAGEARSKILHDYSRFTVLTIDTFFQRILRAFVRELGIDFDYTVEIETESVLARSADALVERIVTDEELRRWLTAFVEERIAEGRKWDVRDGILSLGGELFKEQNREALRSSLPREALQRLVGEAAARAEASRERMRVAARRAVALMEEAGCTASDFTGRSRSFARYFFEVAEGEIKPYTATVRRMSSSPEGWCAADSPALPIAGRLQPILKEMCDLYDSNVRLWNTCDLLRENFRGYALLGDLYREVRGQCDRQHTMLLPETKHLLSEFIGRNDAPFIYEKVGNRFERFLIDEFQDTSAREWQNFLPLLRNAMSQSAATSVLLVGDVKQSIYRWRGGDWRILHEEARRQLGAGVTEVVHLRENYRSLPEVVAFNNRIISDLVAADNAALNRLTAEAAAAGDLSEAEAEALRDTLADAYREHVQTPCRRATRPGYVSVETFDGQPPVVARIRDLLDRGFRPSDILILVRSATDGAKVAAELLAFKGSNTDPRYRFDVMTQEALVVGNAPVAAFVIAALRLALNPDDSLERAVYNRFLGERFGQPLSGEARAFFASLRLLPPEEAFERIVMRHGLGDEPLHTAYLQALHEQIISFSAARIADIGLFLRWWNEEGCRRSLSVERSATTVEIMTIHKAKGLEKRAVILPYCSWSLDPKASGAVANYVWAEAGGEAATLGRFPVRFKKAMSQSGFSKEYYRELVLSHVDNVNLLYVALTRAAESLHVFIPRKGFRHVGKLVTECLAAARDRGGDAGRYAQEGGRERYEFGAFEGPEPGETPPAARHVVLERYRSSLPDLRLRLPSGRYFDDDATLAPRDMGILLHRAFEKAATEADILEAVEGMRLDGLLSEAEARELRGRIDRALSDPRARAWFGGGWREVRNEQEIVVPGTTSTRRPDRVMTDGQRAVAVDYKFGESHPERHRRQMAEYLDLLRRMGYTEVEGYIWYVREGRIEPLAP